MLGEVPEGWERCSLAELSDLQPGFAFKSDKFADTTDIGLPLIRIRDLKNQTPEKFIDDEVPQAFVVHDGDILVGMDGEFRCVTWRGGPAALNQRVLRVFNKLRSNKSWLHYRLAPILAELESKISGTTVKHLSTKDLKNIQVATPPLPEQQRIAEILSSVDESIRATEAVIAQAERVKRGLMEVLLTGGLGSAAIANGEVPEGWHNSDLRSLCTISGEYGANAPKSEFDPNLPRYVRITDIDEGGNLLPDTVVSLPREVAAPYIMEEGDIVIARSGATVGKSYMHIEKNGECAFAGYLVRFRADRNIASPKWIKFCLQSEYFWAWVRDNQRAGAQPNINAKEYGGLLLCVPPLPEQERIAEILSSVDDQITTNRATVEQLQHLKRGLMDDLLTGKVRTVA